MGWYRQINFNWIKKIKYYNFFSFNQKSNNIYDKMKVIIIIIIIMVDWIDFRSENV